MTDVLAQGPTYGFFSGCDLEGYSRLPSHVQRDQQDRLHGAFERAARDCHLPLKRAELQPTGDGHLIRWPADTDPLDLVARLPQAMAVELGMINKTLAPGNQMRVRLTIVGGISEPASYGYAGRAPVTVGRLLNSTQAREALRTASGWPLVLVLGDAVYEDVVAEGHRGLRPEDFSPVMIEEKEYTGRAWISIPGATPTVLEAIAARFSPPSDAKHATLEQGRDDHSATEHDVTPSSTESLPRTSGPGNDRKSGSRSMSTTVVAALIGAAATITAAGIGAVLAWGPPSGSHNETKASNPAATSTVQPLTPAAIQPRSSAASSPPGRGRTEQVDNHAGVQTFLDNQGKTSGRGGIPYATKVHVSCVAPNESSLGSVNAFYKISGGPWDGLYAPANVFANGDALGTAGTHDIDPHVIECSGD